MPKTPATSQRKALKPKSKPTTPRAKSKAPPKKTSRLQGLMPPTPDMGGLGMGPMMGAPTPPPPPMMPPGAGHMSNASQPLGKGGVGAGQSKKKK